MLLSHRLSTKSLAELSHRLAVETEAGVNIRRTWQRESESAGGRTRAKFAEVRAAVESGESLSLALAATDDLFPPLFLEMVHVGEKTGTLGRVFHRLADHYRRQQRLRRIFLAAIFWPVLQLVAAVFVIGALIWILGIVAERNNGQETDVLGFGLVGTRGLVIYTNVVVAACLCLAAVVVAMRRGVFWTRPLQRAVMHIPVVGSCLEKLAMARLAWALHLTLNVEMDLRRVVPLVLRAAGSDYYIRHTDQIVADVSAGMPIHEAFAATGAFPDDFIEPFAVAEESGQMVESMERLSRRYEEEAESATETLTRIAGFVIWLLVAALIITMIFRLAGFYVGTINKALEM
jgi:type IV pilus assembly protein PilC